MSHVRDLSGLIVGRLTVVARAGSNPKGHALWTCHCECGTAVVVLGLNLRDRSNREATKSCGCLQREAIASVQWKHGLRRDHTPEYNTWHGMLRRCYDPSHRAYPYYGERGISVCDAWKDDFPQFLRDMGKRPVGYTIDRIDNDGDYEPTNCRWAPWSTQNNNKRPKGSVCKKPA